MIREGFVFYTLHRNPRYQASRAYRPVDNPFDKFMDAPGLTQRSSSTTARVATLFSVA